MHWNTAYDLLPDLTGLVAPDDSWAAVDDAVPVDPAEGVTAADELWLSAHLTAADLPGGEPGPVGRLVDPLLIAFGLAVGPSTPRPLIGDPVVAGTTIGWAVPGVPFDKVPDGPPPVGELLITLAQAADQVAAVDPLLLDGPLALAETRALLQVMQTLRVTRLERLADIETRRLQHLDAAPSVASWLATQQVDLERGELALAKRLRRLRLLSDAVGHGSVSLGSARKVATALASVRTHVDRADGLIDGQPGEQVLAGVLPAIADLICRSRLGLADDDPRLRPLLSGLREIGDRQDSELGRLEAGFVLLAELVEPGQLKGCLDELLGAILPSKLDDHADHAHQQRSVELFPSWDGSGTHVRMDLDVATSELLVNLLDAEMRRDPANTSDTAAAAQHRALGLDPDDPSLNDPGPDRRSRRQRQHDALTALLERYLAADLAGTVHKAPVRIAVTVSIDRLAQQPGALPAMSGSGQLIPDSLLQQWACDSQLVRLVTGLGRKVLETSHAGRTLTATERQALTAQYGGQCAAAGHTHGRATPGLLLEPHHVQGWADNRRTSLSDTIWACPQLHHDLHTGKHTVRLKNGRYLNENGWADGPAAP